MTIWVGPQSAGAANGTSWANRYGSLNDAEDDPVVAGETVYVGPGVYRELLTCDVSGNAGNPIVYVADVTGENTDGVGGAVRITGSDDDLTGTRANWITATSIDYRTFRGFHFDGQTGGGIYAIEPENWIIEDCGFRGSVTTGPQIEFSGLTQTDNTIRRSMFLGAGRHDIVLRHSAEVDDCNSLIEDCLLIGTRGDGIQMEEVFGVTVRNCTVLATGDGVDSTVAGVAGFTPIQVENCLFISCFDNALEAAQLGDIIEDYNNFIGNVADRSLVDVGTHSTAYMHLLSLPLLYAGASQSSGYQFPWSVGSLSEWSALAGRQGTDPPLVDLYGIERPHPDNRKSWGAVQFAGVERSIAQAHSAVASELHYRPSRKQFFVPTDGTEVTVSAWVYREANYRADRNPGFVLKQPGAADRDTRDAGAVAQWNQITDTFTPNATPPWFMVELVNDNYYSTTTSTTTATSTTQTETSTSTTTSTTTLLVWFDDIGLT